MQPNLQKMKGNLGVTLKENKISNTIKRGMQLPKKWVQNLIASHLNVRGMKDSYT